MLPPVAQAIWTACPMQSLDSLPDITIHFIAWRKCRKDAHADGSINISSVFKRARISSYSFSVLDGKIPASRFSITLPSTNDGLPTASPFASVFPLIPKS